MVTRVGGFRRKTRFKLSRAPRAKGKFPLTAFLRQYKEGDRVQLVADSIYQRGMYHPRFHGRVGTVGKSQGECYQVTLKDGGVSKIFVVHPVHLRSMQ